VSAASAELRSQGCADCHAPRASVFHAAAETRCVDCHAFHDPEQLRLPGSDSAMLVRRGPAEIQGSIHCGACHVPGRHAQDIAAAHLPAAAWYHENAASIATMSVSETCLQCHDNSHDPPPGLDPATNPPRMPVAASHPYSVPVMSRHPRDGYGLRQDIDPRLELIDGRIECTTCHDFYNDEDDLLVAFEPRYSLCLGCHARNEGINLAASAVAR
jgi:predicted CXXCH cytochrome family protein